VANAFAGLMSRLKAAARKDFAVATQAFTPQKRGRSSPRREETLQDCGGFFGANPWRDFHAVI